MTQGKDIAFGVNLIPEGKTKTTSLVPTKRINSHVIPEDGSINCDTLGVCKCLTLAIIVTRCTPWLGLDM